MYSLYYQANVRAKDCWFLTATLRSFEHLAFDRTLDPKTSKFEFFVSQNLENLFLEIMDYYQSLGLVTNLEKLPNRLAIIGESL